MGRTDRATRVLMLLHELERGHVVYKAAYTMEHDITDRSFDRDLRDIRLFYSEAYLSNEVIYDRQLAGYRLAGHTVSELSGMEALVLFKSILTHGGLRKDELAGVLDSILGLVPAPDASAVRFAAARDMPLFDCSGQKALLKLIWDLTKAAEWGEAILLRSEDGTIDQVLPYDIVDCGGGYGLVCWAVDQKAPEYRVLDRLTSFERTYQKIQLTAHQESQLQELCRRYLPRRRTQNGKAEIPPKDARKVTPDPGRSQGLF